MWDLSSPIRDQTYIPCIGRQILYHWTTREDPLTIFLLKSGLLSSISYLLLCNQLPWTWCLKTTHLLSHSFCGSEFWTQCNRVLCFLISHKAAIKGSAKAWASFESSTGKDQLPGSRGCWQNSVPCRLFSWEPQFFAGCQLFLSTWPSP